MRKTALKKLLLLFFLFFALLGYAQGTSAIEEKLSFDQNNTAQEYLVGGERRNMNYFAIKNNPEAVHQIQVLDSMSGRVLAIVNPKTKRRVIFISSDISYDSGFRDLLEENLKKRDPNFDMADIIQGYSHNHSGTAYVKEQLFLTSGKFGGGMSPFDPMDYRSNTNNYIASVFADMVFKALANLEPSTLYFATKRIPDDVPVAFNRALKSYNRNPEVKEKLEKEQNNLAINRNLRMLLVYDKNHKIKNSITFFGAHPLNAYHTCIMTSDYPGLYSYMMEKSIGNNGFSLYMQTAGGDVNSHDSHNSPPAGETRPCHPKIVEPGGFFEQGTEYGTSLDRTGRKVAELLTEQSMDLINNSSYQKIPIFGDIDNESTYKKMTDVEIDPKFGTARTLYIFKTKARTAPAIASGTPSFTPAYTYHDRDDFGGREIGRTLLNSLSDVSRVVRLTGVFLNPFQPWDKKKYNYQMFRWNKGKKLFADAGNVYPKLAGLDLRDESDSKIAAKINSGLTNFTNSVQQGNVLYELPWQDDILDIHISRIGNIAVVKFDPEITTIAQQRLEKTVSEVLKQDGVQEVIVENYGLFSAYITTPEEFRQGRYEGSQNIYGQYSLPAFQMFYHQLATEMLKPKEERNIDRTTRPQIGATEIANRQKNDPTTYYLFSPKKELILKEKHGQIVP